MTLTHKFDPALYPLTFGFSKVSRYLHIFSGLALIVAICLIYYFEVFQSNERSIIAWGLFALFLLGGVFLILRGLVTKIELYPEGIVATGVFVKRSLSRDEIKGYYVESHTSHHGLLHYTVETMYLVSSRTDKSYISIPMSISDDPAFVSWFKTLPDFVRDNSKKLVNEITSDESLGGTQKERISFFTKIEKLRENISIAALVLMIAAFALPESTKAITLPLLALLPLFLFLLLLRYPTTFRFGVKIKYLAAGMETTLLLCALGFLSILAEKEYVSFGAVWQWALIAAALFTAATAAVNQSARAPMAAIGLFICFAAYGFGAVLLVNGYAETARPKQEVALIMCKHVSSKDDYKIDYFIGEQGATVEAEPLRNGCLGMTGKAIERFSVSESFYDAVKVGNFRCRKTYYGLLGADWYEMNRCPGVKDEV